MTRSEQQQEQHTAQWYVRRHSRRLAGRPLACAWREQSKSKKERREKRERKKKEEIRHARVCMRAQWGVGVAAAQGETGHEVFSSLFPSLLFSPFVGEMLFTRCQVIMKRNDDDDDDDDRL